jgi:hypothetical protein
MPTVPLEPGPDRARSIAPHHAHVDGIADLPDILEDPDRRRARRTGVLALVVASTVLWAGIAYAVGIALTM